MLTQKIILRGIGVSPGRVEERVKMITFPEEIDGINEKRIIVTAFLFPDFLTSIKRNNLISGIITENGGLTCHASIITRELGIPYIAGARLATRRLKENMIITIDGEGGGNLR